MLGSLEILKDLDLNLLPVMSVKNTQPFYQVAISDEWIVDKWLVFCLKDNAFIGCVYADTEESARRCKQMTVAAGYLSTYIELTKGILAPEVVFKKPFRVLYGTGFNKRDVIKIEPSSARDLDEFLAANKTTNCRVNNRLPALGVRMSHESKDIYSDWKIFEQASKLVEHIAANFRSMLFIRNALRSSHYYMHVDKDASPYKDFTRIISVIGERVACVNEYRFPAKNKGELIEKYLIDSEMISFQGEYDFNVLTKTQWLSCRKALLEEKGVAIIAASKIAMVLSMGEIRVFYNYLTYSEILAQSVFEVLIDIAKSFNWTVDELSCCK